VLSWCNPAAVPLGIWCSHCILVGVLGYDCLGCVERGVYGSGCREFLWCVSVQEKERMEVRASGVLLEGIGLRGRD